MLSFFYSLKSKAVTQNEMTANKKSTILINSLLVIVWLVVVKRTLAIAKTCCSRVWNDVEDVCDCQPDKIRVRCKLAKQAKYSPPTCQILEIKPEVCQNRQSDGESQAGHKRFVFKRETYRPVDFIHVLVPHF
nr:MAG TPA: hypothetical protein [Caudoviricetes sp.]